MIWNSKLFHNKIKYLLKVLCHNDIDELAEYFCEIDADDSKYRSRKNLIRDIWLSEPLKTPIRIITKKNFKNFNLAKLNIEGEVLFSYESLFIESLEDFKKRVDRFIQFKMKEPINYKMEYRYIYYFVKTLNKVVYVKLENVEQIAYKEYKTDVIINHSNPNNVGNLKAKLKIEENLISIEAKNNYEKVTLYFEYNLLQEKSNTLWGVGISKLYNLKPRASKALLSKNKLNIDEKILFYLNSSESEYLISREVKEEDFFLKEQFYLNKFYYKVKDLFIFLRKIKILFRGKIGSNIYLNIFFEEFKVFTFMYKQVTQKKKYFVANKKRATTIFLKSMVERKSSCYIVYPLFGENANFLVNQEEAINSIDLNIKIVKQGVKLYRIFVIDSFDEINDFVIKTVKRMEQIGIDIQFVIKKDIEPLVSSYDFAFPIEKDVVLYRERTKKSSDFSINLDKSTIIMYTNYYRAIDEKSSKLEEILNLKEKFKA